MCGVNKILVLLENTFYTNNTRVENCQQNVKNTKEHTYRRDDSFDLKFGLCYATP